MSKTKDRGETLIEIVMTVLITAITVTALVSGLATAGSAGQTQRASVTADSVIRNYAEAIKAASRNCTSEGTMTVVYEENEETEDYTVKAEGKNFPACPPVGSPDTVTIKVTGPSGIEEKMQIVVRTP